MTIKSYGIQMEGKLLIQPVAGLPAWTSADVSRIVYNTSDGGVYIGNNTAWVEVGASLGFTPENIINKENATMDTSTTKYPTNRLVKEYTDGLVIGLLDYRGGYSAAGNVFPSTGGSGTAGAILKGDLWVISVPGSLGGQTVAVGDSIISTIDTPGQTVGNWDIFQANIAYVPEDESNKVTTVSAASTDTQYPTAKLIYDDMVPYTGANTSVNLGAYNLTAAKVYNAVYNDIADLITVQSDLEIQYGKCYVRLNDGTVALSNNVAEIGVLGIASDTYGFGVGGEAREGENKLPIGIGGFALACVDQVYPTGTALTCGENGKLVEVPIDIKRDYPERIIATFDKIEPDEEWNDIIVNGRHWVKIK